MSHAQVLSQPLVHIALFRLLGNVVHVGSSIHRHIRLVTNVDVSSLKVSLLEDLRRPLAIFLAVVDLVGGHVRSTHASELEVVLCQVFLLVIRPKS